MNITMLTVGTRGEVEPLVALGIGLQRAGHRVVIATHAAFRNFICQHGLEFSLIDIDLEAHLSSEGFKQSTGGSRNPLKVFKNIVEGQKEAFRQVASGSWRACQDADAVVYTIAGFWAAPHIAEKLGIPAVGAYPYPVSQPTSAFPNIFLSPRRKFSGPLNRLTHQVFDLLSWAPLMSITNDWRRDVLGLSPCGISYPNRYRKLQHPVLFGFSPKVVPRPPDWGDHVQICGYWLLPQDLHWQPPPGLLQFIDKGTKPLFVGFGSVGARKPLETITIVLEALKHTGQRAILQVKPAEAGEIGPSDQIYPIQSAPFGWLFGCTSVVIHHGGAGMTGLGLQAGVPNIIIPTFMDQPFWGWRVAALGAGPAPIDPKQLNASRLADAIDRALHDQEMQNKAAALGREIRQEDGVQAAKKNFL